MKANLLILVTASWVFTVSQLVAQPTLREAFEAQEALVSQHVRTAESAQFALGVVMLHYESARAKLGTTLPSKQRAMFDIITNGRLTRLFRACGETKKADEVEAQALLIASRKRFLLPVERQSITDGDDLLDLLKQIDGIPPFEAKK